MSKDEKGKAPTLKEPTPGTVFTLRDLYAGEPIPEPAVFNQYEVAPGVLGTLEYPTLGTIRKVEAMEPDILNLEAVTKGEAEPEYAETEGKLTHPDTLATHVAFAVLELDTEVTPDDLVPAMCYHVRNAFFTVRFPTSSARGSSYGAEG